MCFTSGASMSIATAMGIARRASKKGRMRAHPRNGHGGRWSSLTRRRSTLQTALVYECPTPVSPHGLSEQHSIRTMPEAGAEGRDMFTDATTAQTVDAANRLTRPV